jgi:lipopolysaccharide/colanic/teichoic acid biosynthesis glycosyltransferase
VGAFPSRRFDAAAIRAFDLLLVLASLVVLLPLFLVVAVAIKSTSPGPVFFRQERLGLDGRRFRIFKFRTMVDGSEHLGLGKLTAHDDDRITRVGRFLRAWSLDELPQVFNVLKGEMSLVGPRPALVEYLDAYDAFQMRRLRVPPGLTGWAQVNGRNALSWPERIERDVWYVDNRSLLLNARIVARTFPVLLRREGVYGPPKNFDMHNRRASRSDGINRSVAG